MDSFKHKSEIVESRKELKSIRPSEKFCYARTSQRDGKPPPPVLTKASNKYLEDDINHLFEAINLRTSKSVDLSDRARRDATKRPMRGGGPNSPGIGFSDNVSLKQALRGLCISQAAEMAAMKRLSKLPGSPSLSETGRFTTSYRSVADTCEEIGEISVAHDEGSSRFSSKVPQASSSRPLSHSAQSSPRYFIRQATKNVLPNPCLNNKIVPAESTSQNALSSPRLFGKAISKQDEKVVPEESILGSFHMSQQTQEPKIKSPNKAAAPTQFVDKLDDIQRLEVVKDEAEDQTSVPPVSSCTSVNGSLEREDYNSGPRKVTRSGGTSIKVTPRLRRKGIPLSNVGKSTRSASRAVKPTTRNRKVPKMESNREPKQVLGNTNLSCENDGVPDHSARKVICQRCRCALKDVRDESSKNLATPISNACSGQPSLVVNPVSELHKNSKSREVDFSQSSKSSIGDYSSSTTTISEESNIRRSSCSIRPHMSKDARWEAINNVKKQNGFLGLGHFNLLKKLGCGDIGTVYLAELIETNCLFAIKVMDNEYLARRKKTPRAQTERAILRILDHPFLPTLYAHFTSDNLSCLVMEFCPGGDLHVLRQKQLGRCFPELAARFYVAEVLLALEYLHMLGVVYRDLKPENIMVREDGHIMLTDFDLSLRCSVTPSLLKPSLVLEPARISGPCAGSNCIDPFCAEPSCKVSCFTPMSRPRKVNPKTEHLSLPQLVVEPTEARSNSFVGTHEYLAPEIIKGEGHGSAVDWWTLGVFLYELLYGKTPFKGAGNEETLTNVVLQNLRFPKRPIVSFQVRDLIRGLLVKEPENRLGSETGAAEIKRHPFFDGLNWALIRCATPPQVPEFCDTEVADQKSNNKYLEYSQGQQEFVMF